MINEYKRIVFSCENIWIVQIKMNALPMRIIAGAAQFEREQKETISF